MFKITCKLNPQICKKNYVLWPSETFSRYTRLVQHSKISDYNSLYVRGYKRKTAWWYWLTEKEMWKKNPMSSGKNSQQTRNIIRTWGRESENKTKIPIANILSDGERTFSKIRNKGKTGFTLLFNITLEFLAIAICGKVRNKKQTNWQGRNKIIFADDGVVCIGNLKAATINNQTIL